MATSMIPEIQYQPCTVEVCCGKKKEERVCSKEILKKACPILHDEIENFQFGQSAPIRINATPEAFDAGMRFLLDPSIQNLPLDEFKAIGLLDFAWKYQSPELQQVAEPLCQHSDFADLHAVSLLNYHSTFLTNNLWTGKQDQENELLAEISRRGSQVLNYISDSKKTFIVDTVKKILEQQRLNVFNEKEVFDCIQEWRNKIVKAVEENEYDNNELSYPCLLQKGQKYRLKVTNRESKLEIQTFYQPACDGQEYEDILRVCGIGNIFGFTFAIAKTSQCIEMLGTSV
ncbi:Hypothetical predicted protein [Cloeon dipterum]|uniref:BTB domain-containing protein n=1 Tax=Cloeon dipterum TaxID=197152 RepID=A0A8S1DML1_9INSE|nr:Hypothetical predicted protein [Cloeon dipterum]